MHVHVSRGGCTPQPHSSADRVTTSEDSVPLSWGRGWG